MEKTCPFFGSAEEVNSSIRQMTDWKNPAYLKNYVQNTSKFLWNRDTAFIEYIEKLIKDCPSGVKPSPVAHQFKGVVITNPEIANELIKHEKGAADKNGGKLDGGPDLGHLCPYMGENLLTTNNPENHKAWKHFFRGNFDPRKVHQQIPMMRTMAAEYFHHTLSDATTVDDLRNWVHQLVCRVVTNVASLNQGVRDYTWNEDGSPNDEFDRVSTAAQKVTNLVSDQVVGNPKSLIDWGTEEKNILEYAAGVVYGASLLEAREKLRKNAFDPQTSGLFERMIAKNLSTEGSERTFSDRTIRDFTLLILIVGPGTTSSGILSVLINMMENTDIQDRMRNEILECEVEPKIALSDPGKHLPFTYAVIQESFRMSPPVPGQTRQILKTIKVASKSLGGEIEFPEGMYILYASYFTNRNAGIWGEDCEEFNPDRFLKEDGTFSSSVKRNLTTFGAGNRHVCSGRAFAETMISTFLYTFVPKYEIVSLDEKSLEGIYQQGGIFLRLNKPVECQIRKV